MELPWFFRIARFRRVKTSPASISSLEKEVQEKFSGDWGIYRVAIHEKGGLDLAAKFLSDKYSVRTLFNTLEMLDVYDALKDAAIQKQKNKS